MIPVPAIKKNFDRYNSPQYKKLNDDKCNDFIALF